MCGSGNPKGGSLLLEGASVKPAQRRRGFCPVLAFGERALMRGCTIFLDML